MGGTASRHDSEGAGGLIIGRLPGIGEGTRKEKGANRFAQTALKSLPEDWPYIEVINRYTTLLGYRDLLVTEQGEAIWYCAGMSCEAAFVQQSGLNNAKENCG